ncbi:MAG: biotin--[acetyl-CoA-carboxylase] ligase [Phycisphaeraceae bacterium]|nr:biotin--[acetyl-CoA-carboxylase] ligase [Phycisphaeraceae bacterium]
MSELNVKLLWRLLRETEPIADVPADQLRLLRQSGCKLEVHPAHGVRLLESGLGVWADLLESVVPQAVVYGRTASTQDVARQMFEQRGKEADSCVATTHEQTRGRGRLGRTWSAPAGSAAIFSRVCLLSERANAATDRITLAASVAVARAIEPMLHRSVRIKWPNDVIVSDRKIAGILVETAQARGCLAAILGIGINVNMPPEALPVPTATSFTALGERADRLLVIAETLRQLDIALHSDADDLLDEWRKRSLLLHHQVELLHDGRSVRGEVIDLDPLDGLIVRTGDGRLVHLPAATTTVVK